MASRTGIVILAAAVSTGLLTVFTDGNVIDQKVLQRELAEITPEIVSLNDKDEFRELGEPVAVAAVNDYKTQADDQNLENALVDYYLFVKEMMMRNKMRARTAANAARGQKKRNYWKQCAFNAVSCFG